MEPAFFATPAAWRDWLEKYHDQRQELLVTPRKPRSVWSAVNIKRVEELTRQGLMRPAGIKAFDARQKDRSGIYSFEQQNIKFERAQELQFQGQRGRLEVLSVAAAFVPARDYLVGGQRETGGDEGKEAGHPD